MLNFRKSRTFRANCDALKKLYFHTLSLLSLSICLFIPPLCLSLISSSYLILTQISLPSPSWILSISLSLSLSFFILSLNLTRVPLPYPSFFLICLSPSICPTLYLWVNGKKGPLGRNGGISSSSQWRTVTPRERILVTSFFFVVSFQKESFYQLLTLELKEKKISMGRYGSSTIIWPYPKRNEMIVLLKYCN